MENHASNFCSEYSRHRSDSTTYNFGASYEFLSASFGSGHASADDVASKFCSSDSSGHASAGAYQSYIENIAPGAYGAYAKCLQLKDNSIEFSIPEATVLKDQFVLTLTFKPAGKKVLVSSPLHPKGYLVVGISATNLAERLSQESVATLSCSRSNYKQQSFVEVSQQTDGEAKFSVPWQAYNDEGIPVNVIADLTRKIATANSEIEKLKRSQVQVESGDITIAKGPDSRDLEDGSSCNNNPDNLRGLKNARINFHQPFKSVPKVVVGLHQLDLPQGEMRLWIKVETVDKSGFNYSFITWCTSRVNGAEAQWIAVAP